MNPKISVIVPVYKVEKYLHRCIDSILLQTFPDFELLLVDDGSPDRSGEICDEYVKKDSRIRVFHKENGGVSSARNHGIEKAIGEWIMFVDSDDWLESDYLSNFDIEGDYDIQLQGFTNDFPGKESISLGCEITKEVNLPTFFIEASRKFLIYGPVFKLYKRSIIGNIRFDHNFSLGEDYLFVLNVMQFAKTFKLIQGTGYHYVHEREDSLTRAIKPYDITLKLYNTCDKLRLALCKKYNDSELIKVCNNRYFLEIFLFTYRDFFRDKKNSFIQFKELCKNVDFSKSRAFGLGVKYKFLYMINKCRLKRIAYFAFKVYYN